MLNYLEDVLNENGIVLDAAQDEDEEEQDEETNKLSKRIFRRRVYSFFRTRSITVE